MFHCFTSHKARVELNYLTNCLILLLQLTWADIVVANMLDLMAGLLEINLEADFSTLDAFKCKIFNLPKIKKWIETRPVTDF